VLGGKRDESEVHQSESSINLIPRPKYLPLSNSTKAMLGGKRDESEIHQSESSINLILEIHGSCATSHGIHMNSLL
jgi:hypothetical protein